MATGMKAKPSVRAMAALIRAAGAAYARKGSFLLAFAFVFLITFRVLSVLDLLPDPIPAVQADEQQATVATSTPVQTVVASIPESPTRIEIPSIKLSVSVSNPVSTDIEVLDTALLKGAVRYPSSSNLGEEGNVIIFGHSSYLPIVHNQAYKAFDGIQNLKKDDRITVYGSGHAYVYAVDIVEKKSATDDGISMNVAGPTLTLATCDSFGEKSDRFVVSAHLVESYAVAS